MTNPRTFAPEAEAAALEYTTERLRDAWESFCSLGGKPSEIDVIAYDRTAFTFKCPECPERVEVRPVRPEVGDAPGLLGFVEMTHAEPFACSMKRREDSLTDDLITCKRIREGMEADLSSGAVDLKTVRLKRLLGGSEVEWLIPDVMERGKLAALFGPPKIGKSLLALQWAVELAQSGKRVAYFDEENDPVEVDVRLAAMGVNLSSLDGLRYYSFAGWSVDTEDGATEILDRAERSRLTIFDSWAKFFVGGSQSDDATANRAYRNVLKPLRAAGVGVLRLDHTGHEETRRPSGSVQKLADVDHNWLMRAKRVDRGEPVPITLTHAENRTGRGEDLITLTRDPKTLLCTPLVGKPETEDVAGSTDDERMSTLIDLLDSMSIPTDWTVRAVQDALRATGKGSRTGLIGEAQRIRRSA